MQEPPIRRYRPSTPQTGRRKKEDELHELTRLLLFAVVRQLERCHRRARPETQLQRSSPVRCALPPHLMSELTSLPSKFQRRHAESSASVLHPPSSLPFLSLPSCSHILALSGVSVEPDELEGVHTHTFKLKPFKKAKSCDICKQAITKEGLICKVSLKSSGLYVFSILPALYRYRGALLGAPPRC
ncbi:hypothetical protein D9C73_000646 [Collichthys lucidus]|uniref:Phorbol-ester/DAG-type domain-containing protein n=1 Tax=Collichthys lucidus TaxID=240159 RepID=A0A4U5TYN2_COLLU|nr:hypothetical protein D9C73_000646 [Collichthys lucidus]